MGMRWDPMREVMSLREAMDRLLEESVIRPRAGGSPAGGRGGQTLPVDLWETNDSFILRAPMPGAKLEAGDVDVSIDQNVLTLRARLPGVANEESEGKGSNERGTGVRWILHEVPRGEFSRTVELPMAVDPEQVRAHFGDGLLLLTLPKAQAARPRQIKITAASPTSQHGGGATAGATGSQQGAGGSGQPGGGASSSRQGAGASGQQTT